MAELLAVMAIVSLLLGMGVSAMNVWRSEALTASGNRIADLAAMARQNSLAKGTSTAIVIKAADEFAYAAVCVMELARSDDGSTGTWKPLMPWTFLREGLIFSPEGTDNFLIQGGGLPGDFPAQIPLRGKTVDSSSLVVQVYRPDGTLSAGQVLRLRLIEGVAGGTAGTVTPTRPSADGRPANFYDIVFLRDTGQIKVERL